MKTLIFSAAYIVAVAELFLSFYLWRTSSRNIVGKILSLLCLSLSLWAFTNAGIGLPVEIELRLVYVLAPLILTFLLLFALVYPIPSIILDRYHIISLFVPTFIFVWAIVFTNSVIVNSFYTKIMSTVTIGGDLFTLFNIYLLVLYVSSILVLFLKSRKLDGHLKRNSNLVMLGLTVGGLPAIILAVLHQFENLPYNFLFGPIFSGLLVLVCVYILRKK